MKILYHCGNPKLNYQAPTGYGRHIRGMVKGFQQLGHEVVLDIAGGTELSEGGKSDAPAQGKGKRIFKKLIPSRIWESIKDFRLLKQNEACYQQLLVKAKAEKPELIYERVSYLHDAGVRVGKELGIPVALEVNTPFREAKEVFEGKTLLMSKAERMEERILKGADAVFPVSSAIREHYIEKYELDPSKIKTVPNAIDPEELQVDQGRVEELRKKLGIGADETVIGFVGSIFPYHGVDKLLNAYFELLEERSDIVLLVVGDGELLPELQRAAAEKGQGKVIFTGKVSGEAITDYIGAMDIAVVPGSQWFNSPVKLFEYGLMGKPVVAVAVAGVRDVLEEGGTGKLFRKGTKEMATSLREMLEDEALREHTAKALQEKVLADHIWERNARIVLEQSINEKWGAEE